jgi:hypothetical protein
LTSADCGLTPKNFHPLLFSIRTPQSATRNRQFINGQGWVRTTVGVSQWIYSPSPLAARAPTRLIHGADGGTQTPDQLITNQLLYQLSYIGKLFFAETSLVNIHGAGVASQIKIQFYSTIFTRLLGAPLSRVSRDSRRPSIGLTYVATGNTLPLVGAARPEVALATGSAVLRSCAPAVRPGAKPGFGTIFQPLLIIKRHLIKVPLHIPSLV